MNKCGSALWVHMHQCMLWMIDILILSLSYIADVQVSLRQGPFTPRGRIFEFSASV
ncbi:hypothetical protein NEOLEDRAFT_1132472 [Neolentinus lepideus HHB14362 ss-1]|uniref:Uncharacterized protein n=1 Tax=Neolentinus lepideus HHB14362 ss-1 TaxID=1314782 RepID=A0A165TB65_9AGAM|nr:hypothetical protein NEOLEDRAFT_1132472 [Neolentinus lepideus HHB14362 ss-1]